LERIGSGLEPFGSTQQRQRVQAIFRVETTFLDRGDVIHINVVAWKRAQFKSSLMHRRIK
jgi:hypothetical protein